MRSHIIAAAFALALLAGCAKEGATQSSAPDINGVWAQEPAFTTDGRPSYLGMVAWAPLSQGKPEDRKPPTAAEIQGDKPFTPPPTLNVFTAMLVGGPPLPLTDEGKIARERIKAEYPPRTDENSYLLCTPANRSGIGGAMVQIVQGPQAITLYGETGARIIYMDGRSFDRAVLPQWAGYSIGHWEGDTLVVETRNFKGDYLDRFPVSDEAKLTEYFHMAADHKSLTVRTIFEDPKYFTEPMGMMVYLKSYPDSDVQEDVCLEGLKDMIDYGKAPEQSLYKSTK